MDIDPIAGGPKPAIVGPEPDAHGQAALMLTESLLYTLVEERVLTTAEVVGVVRTACGIKAEVAEATGESEGRMRESLTLLDAIGESLAMAEPTKKTGSA